MLVDNMNMERKGTVLALAMSFVSGGLVAGPVISGALYQLAGYWTAWSVPFALLTLDFVARLAMVDREPEPLLLGKPIVDSRRLGQEESDGLLPTHPRASDYETMERNPDIVCGDSAESFDPSSDESQGFETPSRGFYRTLLLDPRILVGLANTMGQAVIFASFDTTLPLYLLNTFHWGSFSVGMMFLGIQGPPVILGILIGGLRDHLGLRLPTVLGWILVAPCLWLLAVPWWPLFPWAAPESHGEAVVIGSIVGIGFGFLLIRGSGAFQLVGMVIDAVCLCPWLIMGQLSQRMWKLKLQVFLAPMEPTPRYSP